jgi:SAM-dependent methyltransferase
MDPTAAQIREHYEIEKELASRLRGASKDERRSLYSSLYDELYRRVPHHPQLTQKASPEEKKRAVAMQMKFLGRFFGPGDVFLEVGPGDCALALEAAKKAKRVYAVDVSDEITKAAAFPENFELILSDGCAIPVPPGSVQVVYGNQLMEHLHPDDAFEQLENIHRVLAPGGLYVCVTPNRLAGPHDVSKYFDPVATGFHLKEYSVAEMRTLFRKAGFKKVRTYLGAKGFFLRFPVLPLIVCEKILEMLPRSLCRTIAGSAPFRALLNGRFVGVK